MAKKREKTPFGLTEAGFRLQTKVQAGEAKLELVEVAIGDGYLDEGQSELTVTELVHEIPSRHTGEDGTKPCVDFTRIYKGEDENGKPVCMINVVAQNGDNEETAIRECIFYANDPTDGRIAYAYTNLGDGAFPFPKYSGKEHVSYDWNFSTYVTNTQDVTANITLVMGVSREEFDAHVNDTGNPHGVTAEQAGAIPASEKGTAGGVAELDENGHVLSSQLPSYVDDVKEGYLYEGVFYKDEAHTAVIAAEKDKIYIDLDKNLQYRWGGSTYVCLSSALALGETAQTAYRGDRGKEAYDHSQLTSGNPHRVTKFDVGLGSVENKTPIEILAALTKDMVIEALGYTPPTTNTTYSVATSSRNGLMSSSDKSKLDGLTVDDTMSASSTNPLQNKVVWFWMNELDKRLKKLEG